MNDKPKLPSIESVTEALQEAAEKYDAAKISQLNAERALTEATNRLNATQKKFDKVVEEIRQNAPHGSDWANNKCRLRKALGEAEGPV